MKSLYKKKPIIAITLGDPAGIGPEVVLKSLQDRKIYDQCRPLLIADSRILLHKKYRHFPKIRIILNPAEARYQFGAIDVLHLPASPCPEFSFGKPSAATGWISALWVVKSVDLSVTKVVDGIVHAPISKSAWKAAGIHDSGHTEMIARLCGVKKVAMAIASEPLRTVMVTRHLPLNRVSEFLKKENVIETIECAEEWMRRIGIRRPRIGVCSLNPHAGENGFLGKEELKIIQPAIQSARKKTRAVLSGPLPSDSAFRDHRNGLYDCLLTMYHDQSMIPLKLFNSEKLVNITLGLPFPRTSPGHGTAFDIAGKNCADPNPMKEAILTCATLAG